ncbi:MAG: TetR/AcrR family transcriptional regulator [Syntrophales bacterium]
MKLSDKRAHILRAALELIAERGFHDAPMAEIAEKAGVAAGTIYRYFASKEVLITELHRELEEGISAALRKDYPIERPLRERFRYLIRELLGYFIAHPLHFRYMEQFFNSPYGIALHRDRVLGKPGTDDILMDIFTFGVEQRTIKALPKAVLFSLAFGPVLSLLRDHVMDFVVLTPPLIDRITEACWDAIKAEPAQGVRCGP